MPFKEYVHSVLIVSSSETFNNSFSALLPQKDYSPVDLCRMTLAENLLLISATVNIPLQHY